MRENVIPVSRQTLPPFGHARFCVEYPDECEPNGAGNVEHPDGLKQLQQVNLRINLKISPRSEQGDHWTLAEKAGDCEDYALLKRKALIEQGWPSQQLRIATVLTADGIGHAVLVAKFQQQDYVLDNLSGALRRWDQTGYRFLKIQSETDPKVWYSVAGQPTGQSPLS